MLELTKPAELNGHPKSLPQQRVVVAPTRLQAKPVGQEPGAARTQVFGFPVAG